MYSMIGTLTLLALARSKRFRLVRRLPKAWDCYTTRLIARGVRAAR